MSSPKACSCSCGSPCFFRISCGCCGSHEGLPLAAPLDLLGATASWLASDCFGTGGGAIRPLALPPGPEPFERMASRFASGAAGRGGGGVLALPLPFILLGAAVGSSVAGRGGGSGVPFPFALAPGPAAPGGGGGPGGGGSVLASAGCCDAAFPLPFDKSGRPDIPLGMKRVLDFAGAAFPLPASARSFLATSLAGSSSRRLLMRPEDPWPAFGLFACGSS